MKTRTLICLIMAVGIVCLTAACDLIDRPSGFTRPRHSTGDNPSSSDRNGNGDGAGGLKQDTIVYVTAVEFPQGYRWQQDPSGRAGSRIVVYKNGERFMEVPSGEDTFVSPDPDMHRWLDGHLYSDFSTSSHTIISRDGAELFRYEGREMIQGLLVRGDDVYTLGQNRSGQGISFRKNGELLFGKKGAYTIGDISNTCCTTGALYEDDGTLVFCYKVPLGSEPGMYTYYMVRDGTPVELIMESKVSAVHDIRIINGILYKAVSMSGSNYIFLYEGDLVRSFVLGAEMVANCRILWAGQSIYVKTDASYDKWDSARSYIWDMSGTCHETGLYSWAFDYYVSESAVGWIRTYGEELVKTVTMVGTSGKMEYTPGLEYTFMSSSCAAIAGETFYVGLSPTVQGMYPLLYKGASPQEIRINGFISSVNVVLEE